MKQMIYDGSGVTRLLHVENCNGEQIVVLNIRGSHPCAYVSVPESLSNEECDYDYYCVDSEDPDAYVHGGFTYGKYGKPFNSDEIKEAFWLGWDYAHAGDYTYMGDYTYSCILPRERKWTTEEIVEAARKVVGHVKLDENMYD